MARNITRPRTNTERGRASRFSKLADAGQLGKRDTAWLERHRESVKAHKRARAKRPLLPKATRARTNTERGRASRQRKKLREGGTLTKREARQLKRHDEAVTEGRRDRSRRAARTRKRSILGDARAIARELGDWISNGDPGILEDVERGEVVKGSRLTAGIQASFTGDPPDLLPDGPPDIAGTLSKGHALTVRARFRVSKPGRPPAHVWTTILAYTDNADLAELDLWGKFVEAYDAYKATGTQAISALVGKA